MRLRHGLALAGLAVLCLAPAITRGAVGRRHVHLVKSEPAANDTIAAPKEIRLWFSEKVELKVTTMKLATSAGSAVAVAAPERPGVDDKAPVVVSVTTTLAPGAYTISWSTGSGDGHPAKGTVDFVVKSAR